jgi:uncharacterized protein YdhG (YjbR/CyaY superfamily)
MQIAVKDIDTYISLQSEEARVALEELRHTIQSAAPDAEEAISYGMPAFRYHGMLVYFAAFKNHYSLFPGNASLIDELKNELKGYTTSKGTIQFTFGKPLPKALVKKIVKLRMKENLAKEKAKAMKKSTKTK